MEPQATHQIQTPLSTGPGGGGGGGGRGGGKQGVVWIAVSRQGTGRPQATHKIQTFLLTLVKCNRLKAELAGCEYERL